MGRSLSAAALILTLLGPRAWGGLLGTGEKDSLVEACSVADAELAEIQNTSFLSMERARETLIYLPKEDRYALLAMPGCRVTRLADVAARQGLAAMQVRPGGARLFRTLAAGSAVFSHWHAPSAAQTPALLPADPAAAKPEYPILSEDGRWTAVLRTVRAGQDNRNELVLRKINGTGRRAFWPAGLEWSWHELVAIDVVKEQAVLSRGLREYVWVGFDGKIIRGPVSTADVHAQPSTFLWVLDGWFAWDAYRDSGAERVSLRSSSVNFTAQAERLRLISQAAVSPDGRHAAASLETNHGRLLSLKDCVVVYDTREGSEIFRRYLPRFTRSRAVFLGDDFFAYTEPGRVRVLRLNR